MSDLVERLRKPIDADRIYDWIVEKRKKHRSDFPRLGFVNEMELIDEERNEAATRITELETALVEELVIAWLLEQAKWHDKYDDGWSGFDKIAQGYREAADAIEKGAHKNIS